MKQLGKAFFLIVTCFPIVIQANGWGDFSTNDFIEDKKENNPVEETWIPSKPPSSVEEKVEEKVEEENLSKRETIQFSTEKNANVVTYIDTGIEAKKEIEKEVLDGLLKQIARSSKGVVVEDEKNFAFLLDGKLYVIEKKAYLWEDFAALFTPTRIEVTRQKSRRHEQFNLADYIEVYKEAPLMVNGKKIELFNEPIIENSRVLLPVREVVEGLGAIIKSEKDAENKIKAIIKNENVVIEIREGRESILINDKEVKTGTIAKLVDSKDGERFFANLDAIIESLGGEIYWDARKRTIVIEN